jgi:L-cystine uptake protein TcyP (sodium:dicarboxylate symporter family)
MQPPSVDVSLALIDKLLHFLMFFFAMMWFMYITKKWLIAAVSLILLGLILEWMQNSVINRSFEWFDLIADGTGIVLCLILLPVLIDKYFDSSV